MRALRTEKHANNYFTDKKNSHMSIGTYHLCGTCIFLLIFLFKIMINIGEILNIYRQNENMIMIIGI